MKAVISLTPSESKRLISKAVACMPEVQSAWRSGYLLLSDGTTNAMIAQELTRDRTRDLQRQAVGVSTNRVLCVTAPKNRSSFPGVFYQGIPQLNRSFAEALADWNQNTVIIKGANALDPNGHVGIIMTGFDGGTIPHILGSVISRGLSLIVPIGLEKMIPSVPAAAKALGGSKTIDISMGADGGMLCLSNAIVITELEALFQLYGVTSTPIASGGIGGSEGAVVLSMEGSPAQITAAVEDLEQNIKGEPPIPGNKGCCETCQYRKCRYHGLPQEQLPPWLKQKACK